MSRLSSTVLLLSAALLVGGPGVVHGQTRDPVAAEALFEEGRRLSKADQHEAAAEKFAEAFRLDPTAGAAMNLAGTQEVLGQVASAWESWRTALEYLALSDSRRRRAVQKRIDALNPMVPRLVIELEPGVASDVEIRRDGVQLGTAVLGVPLPVDPGPHVVEVSAKGTDPKRYEVTLEKGESKTLAVRPGEPAEPTAAPKPTPFSVSTDFADGAVAPPVQITTTPVPADDGSPWATTLFAGGIAVAGLAGASALFAHRARQDIDEACKDGAQGRYCLFSAKDALERDKRYSLIADVGFGLGAALIGAGLYAWISDDEGRPQAHLTPVPGGLRFAVSGGF